MSGFPPTDSPSAAALEAVDAAVPLAQATGVDADALQAIGTARQGIDLAQSAAAGDGMALAQGATALAAQHSADVARYAGIAQSAVQVAGAAQALRGVGQGPAAQELGLGPAGGIAAPAAAVLDIDDDPRNGSAIADFASPPGGLAPRAAPAEQAEAGGTSPSPFIQALQAIIGSNRLLRMDVVLPADSKAGKKLFLAAIEGEAALSKPYQYQLEMVSLDASLHLKDMLGTVVTVAIRLADGGEQFINGVISDFGFDRTDGGLAHYHATFVPWTAVLGLRVNSRIFQDVTVLDVVERVLGDYASLRMTHDVRVFNELPKLNYLVQYGETDLDFFHRILAQAGLFYYFEHTDRAHKLVICDDSTRAECCPPQQVHARVRFNGGEHVDSEDNIIWLSAKRSLQPNAVALNTYDFKQPSAQRYLEVPGLTDQGQVPRLEQYDGNPAFAYRDMADGNREARLRLELMEWQAKVFTAGSECRAMNVGHTFVLREHFWFKDDNDADLLVIGQTLKARNNFDNNIGTAHANAGIYESTLSLIRRKIPFRPLRDTPKPTMKGLQTATVVGPKGLEIHTDAYGRIKVQFPWDREGRHNESSSCWIRVSQPWAGKGWGTVAIPRVGQEVLIDFMEGDPDRPVCMGRMFNAEQTPPYALPDGAHQMGFKSRSTPGGGGYCEMVIHDQKGQELINIHSQKDMNITVQDTMATVVNGPEQTNVVTTGRQVNTVYHSIAVTSQSQHIAMKAHTAFSLEAETHNLSATAKEQVEIKSTDSHVLIEGKTSVKLVAGKSSLELREDGTILLNGVVVQIVGTSSIDLNP